MSSVMNNIEDRLGAHPIFFGDSGVGCSSFGISLADFASVIVAKFSAKSPDSSFPHSTLNQFRHSIWNWKVIPVPTIEHSVYHVYRRVEFSPNVIRIHPSGSAQSTNFLCQCVGYCRHSMTFSRWNSTACSLIIFIIGMRPVEKVLGIATRRIITRMTNHSNHLKRNRVANAICNPMRPQGLLFFGMADGEFSVSPRGSTFRPWPARVWPIRSVHLGMKTSNVTWGKMDLHRRVLSCVSPPGRLAAMRGFFVPALYQKGY